MSCTGRFKIWLSLCKLGTGIPQFWSIRNISALSLRAAWTDSRQFQSVYV